MRTWRFDYSLVVRAQAGKYEIYPRFRCGSKQAAGKTALWQGGGFGVKDFFDDYYQDIVIDFHRVSPTDGRAPDYDDWELNGDILLWNDVLGRSFEISSMGIRVDAESLERQLELAGCPERRELEFHRLLLEGKLPLTMGGGIGQSRMCMLMMQTAHIGEVQASIWDETTRTECEKAGAILL